LELWTIRAEAQSGHVHFPLVIYILQLALRRYSGQTRTFWRPAVRNVSTAAQPNASRPESPFDLPTTQEPLALQFCCPAISLHQRQAFQICHHRSDEIQRVFDIGLPIVQELRRNPDYVEKDVYENFSDLIFQRPRNRWRCNFVVQPFPCTNAKRSKYATIDQTAISSSWPFAGTQDRHELFGDQRSETSAPRHNQMPL
jgi:hypothetical protein